MQELLFLYLLLFLFLLIFHCHPCRVSVRSEPNSSHSGEPCQISFGRHGLIIFADVWLKRRSVCCFSQSCLLKVSWAWRLMRFLRHKPALIGSQRWRLTQAWANCSLPNLEAFIAMGRHKTAVFHPSLQRVRGHFKKEQNTVGLQRHWFLFIFNWYPHVSNASHDSQSGLVSPANNL